MANRKASAIGRLESALGVIGLLALATTYGLITGWNPWDGFLSWLQRVSSLSQPETAWKVRLGDRPEYAVPTDRAVIVVVRGGAESRDARTGEKLWTRPALWAAVAGADSRVVVVTGHPGGKGFDAIDPVSGAVRWSDGDALAVWTYREAVLALTCPGPSQCTLHAHDPPGGQVWWRTPLPGNGKVLAGVNHELPGGRELLTSTMDDRAAGPAELPTMLGFPLDGKVQVVDTRTGRRVREATPSATKRIVVVGGRILSSTAERRQGQCRYVLEAVDPHSGQRVWQKEGYDLRTASGAGCEQRRDPGGGGGTLLAIRGDNREVLLNAADGRELWIGAPGEHVLATDGLTALVRTANGKTVKALDLGDRTVLWQHDVGKNAAAAVTRYAAVVVNGEHVFAFEVGTGRVLVDAESGARVIGTGVAGLVLSTGRTVGLLRFGSVAQG